MAMPAGHPILALRAGWPMPIDRLTTKTSNESYRYYFIDPQEYRVAMERAAYLDSVNCPLRAWRVRMNLDGTQPTYAPAGPDDKDEVEGPLHSEVNRRGPNKRPLRERVRDSAAEYARRKARKTGVAR